MPDNTPAELDLPSLAEAVSNVDLILRTQYKSFQALSKTLHTAMEADAQARKITEFVAAKEIALVTLDNELAAKTVQAQATIQSLGDRILGLTQEVKEKLDQEYAKQRASSAEAMQAANDALTALLAAIEIKTDECNAIDAKKLELERGVVELETRAATAEAKVEAARKALADARDGI